MGAKQEIYQLMLELAKEGMAILMISSEMPELLGMSDTIMVMHEGEVMGQLSKEEAAGKDSGTGFRYTRRINMKSKNTLKQFSTIILLAVMILFSLFYGFLSGSEKCN